MVLYLYQLQRSPQFENLQILVNHITDFIYHPHTVQEFHLDRKLKLFYVLFLVNLLILIEFMKMLVIELLSYIKEIIVFELNAFYECLKIKFNDYLKFFNLLLNFNKFNHYNSYLNLYCFMIIYLDFHLDQEIS